MRLILLLSIICVRMYLPGQTTHPVGQNELLQEKFELNIRLNAFRVLETKCNPCHQIKNRPKVFSLENMNSVATKIHKQVIVRKRMPKGNDYTLSSGDFQELKNWMSNLK